MKPRYPRINPDRDRKRRFYLDEDVVLTLESGQQFLIPKGYRFDGHSVPFPFTAFFPVFDTDVYAALVHDYLIDTIPFHRLTKSEINNEYDRFMKDQTYHSTKLRRWLFPLAVRFWSQTPFSSW